MSLPVRIGRYRVLDLVGQGAMGVVYRGRDDALERDVALKVMSLGHDADPDSRARFMREARAAARLQHPNIVTIYELGDHEGSPFMAMELLEGMDLQRAIEGGLRPDPRRTLPIALQLLAGLGHAHENGIVHRDVKPSNLFLPRKRPAKIMDFGVARLAGGGTMAGAVVGTPNYMSPEQVRGDSLDGRSDLFSAGLILYELVTGEKAYKGDSIVALMYKIAHEPVDLGLISSESSWERLRRVLARSLAHDRDQRYADARAMSGDLAAALLDLGGTPDWATASNWGVVSRTTQRSVPPSAAAPEEPPILHRPPGVISASSAAPTSPERPRGNESRFGRQEETPPAGLDVPPPRGGEGRSLTAASGLPDASSEVAVSSQRGPLLAAGGLVLAAVVLLLSALLALRRSSAPRMREPSASIAAPSSPIAASRPQPAPTPPPSVAPLPRPGAAQPTRAARSPAPQAPAGEPDPADARAPKATALLEEGRYSAALAEARAVLRRDPRNEEAKTVAEEAEAALVIEESIRKARAALKNGDKDAAMEHLKIGLSVNSNERRLLELWRQATQ